MPGPPAGPGAVIGNCMRPSAGLGGDGAGEGSGPPAGPSVGPVAISGVWGGHGMFNGNGNGFNGFNGYV